MKRLEEEIRQMERTVADRERTILKLQIKCNDSIESEFSKQQSAFTGKRLIQKREVVDIYNEFHNSLPGQPELDPL